MAARGPATRCGGRGRVSRCPYRYRRPSASGRRVCDVDRDRGGARAPVGTRIRRLLQAGIRRTPQLAANHPGRPASSGREHRPPCGRIGRAYSRRVVDQNREAIAPTVGPFHDHLRGAHQRSRSARTRRFRDAALARAPERPSSGGIDDPSGADRRRTSRLDVVHGAHPGSPSTLTAPTEVLASAGKAHRGGEREHHRRPRPGYRRRLEARRCACLLRLRQRRALGGLPCLRPRTPDWSCRYGIPRWVARRRNTYPRRPRSPRGWPYRSARALRRTRGTRDGGGTSLPGHLALSTHRARRARMHAPPGRPAASPRPTKRATPRCARARGGTAGRFVVTGCRPEPLPPSRRRRKQEPLLRTVVVRFYHVWRHSISRATKAEPRYRDERTARIRPTACRR